MNWVGGARSRVRQQNERKVQKEFFERKRLLGVPAKRPHSSTSPMVVKYKRSISQDLLSLKALSDAFDANTNTNQDIKKPQKVSLAGPKQGRSYDFNLELPMSPITQPSTLEFQDASSGGVSFYETQPRVSTSKIPTIHSQQKQLIQMPSPTKPLITTNKFSFNSTLDIEDTTNTSALTESIFPMHKKPHTKSNSQFDYTMKSGYSELPVLLDKRPKPPPFSQRSMLDTERPVFDVGDHRTKPNSLYSWEEVNWYGQKGKTKNNPPQDHVLKKAPKSYHDRETPFPTTAKATHRLSLVDFHKTQHNSSPNKCLHHQQYPLLDRDITNNKAITGANLLSKSQCISSLLDEDPVGWFTPLTSSHQKHTSSLNSSPIQQIHCEQSIPHSSTLESDYKEIDSSLQKTVSPDTHVLHKDYCFKEAITNKPMSAFEVMIQSLERSQNTQNSDVPNKITDSQDKSDECIAQHNKWMDFINGSRLVQEKVDDLSLVPSHTTLSKDVTNTIGEDEETVSSFSNEQMKVPNLQDSITDAYEMESNILLSQDMAFSTQNFEITDHKEQCDGSSIVNTIKFYEDDFSLDKYLSTPLFVQSYNRTIDNDVQMVTKPLDDTIDTDTAPPVSENNTTSTTVVSTQTDVIAVCNTEVQTDVFQLCDMNIKNDCALETQSNTNYTDAVIQTDQLDCYDMDVQTDTIHLLEAPIHAQKPSSTILHLNSVESQLLSLTNNIAQEMVSLNEDIASDIATRDNGSLLAKTNELISLLDKRQSDLIWYSLMLKLMQIDNN